MLTDSTDASREHTEGVPCPLKIVIVDDEPQVLEVVTSMLEYLGCEVTAFADGQKAARCLENRKYDGLVVDARMPKLDGFELTRQVRASPLNGEVPIVMLTGYDDLKTMRQAFRSGISFFLGKPLTVDKASTVFNAIRGAKLRDRRLSPRLPFRGPVFVRIGPHFQKDMDAVSVNISEGGLLLEAAQGVEVGQEVELEFKTPSAEKPVLVRAKVQRKESVERLGVEFVNLEPDDREGIRRFILWGGKA